MKIFKRILGAIIISQIFALLICLLTISIGKTDIIPAIIISEVTVFSIVAIVFLFIIGLILLES